MYLMISAVPFQDMSLAMTLLAEMIWCHQDLLSVNNKRENSHTTECGYTQAEN